MHGCAVLAYQLPSVIKIHAKTGKKQAVKEGRYYLHHTGLGKKLVAANFLNNVLQ